METAIVGIVGKGILGKAISETYEGFKQIHTQHPDYCSVKKTIVELDIISKMEIINNVINAIDDGSDIIKMQTTKLKSCLEQLKTDMKSINKITKEHHQKYFSYWRTADYSVPLNSLKFHFSLLENRFNLLIKLIKIESLTKK